MNAKLMAFATTAAAVIVGLYAYNKWVVGSASTEFRGRRK
jgi:hypothetical protein